MTKVPARLLVRLAAITAVVGALSTVGTGQAPALDTRLIQAARAGDLQTVRTLIAQRANVDAVSGDGATALLWASYKGDVEMTRALTAAGADANAANRLGVTPVLQASRLGHAEVLRVLLDAGATGAATYRDGETALMAAAESGNLTAVQLLLDRGAQVNARERGQDQSALMRAASAGHTDVVRALLAAGANPNFVARPSTLSRARGDGGRMWVDWSTGGLTTLMFAAREGHLDAARVLAEAGAELDRATPDGLTATMIAIINDRLDLAGMLIEKGAGAGDGSLYEAIRQHNLRTNETTGEATRPRPDHPNTLTPLDLIQRLLERGADPQRVATHTLHLDGTGQPGPVNESPFARALQAQDVAVLRVLVANGANSRQPATDGTIPLIAALGAPGGRGGFAGGFGAQPAAFRFPSERSATAAVTTLLDAGADVNASRQNGDTALHVAAQTGNVAVIQLLADRGAKLDVQNSAGLTPLDLAMGRQPPPGSGAPAGPPRGGGGGGQGARGGGPPQPQPAAIALLRQLMGLPADAAASSAGAGQAAGPGGNR